MMRFRTKVDTWIAAVMWFSLGIMHVTIYIARDWSAYLYVAPFLVIILLLIIPCDYTFTEKELIIRSGLIKWRVDYSKISRVKPTRNPLSSPAWSLDRLKIHYGKTWVMVSPERRAEFLDEMAKRTGLIRNGEELVMPD